MGDKKRTTNKTVEIDDKLCFISNGPITLFILCVVYKPLLITKNESKLKSKMELRARTLTSGFVLYAFIYMKYTHWNLG